MDKEQVTRVLDLYKRMEKAVEESNLSDTWKTIIKGEARTQALLIESKQVRGFKQ